MALLRRARREFAAAAPIPPWQDICFWDFSAIGVTARRSLAGNNKLVKLATS